MTQSQMFCGSSYLLYKVIYSFKQSTRQWFAILSTHIQTLCFKNCSVDLSLMFYINSNIHLFLLMYADNILLTSNKNQATNILQQSLKQKFHKKKTREIVELMSMFIELKGWEFIHHSLSLVLNFDSKRIIDLL